MKNIFISVVAIAAIAVGYQKYNQSQTMSDLMLANVEALANSETGDKIPCHSSLVGSGQSVICSTCDTALGSPHPDSISHWSTRK